MMSKLTFTFFVLVVTIVECSALPINETTTVPPEVPTDALLHITEGIKDDDVQIVTGKKELEEAVTGKVEGTNAPASEKYKDEDKDKEGAINMLKDKDEEEDKNEVEDEDECKDKDEGEDNDEVEDEDECKDEDEEELMDECNDEREDIDEVEDKDKEEDKEETLPDSTVKPSIVVTVAPEQVTTKSA